MIYLLGIDVGTSGIKSLIVDYEGNVKGKSLVEHPIFHSYSGWSEQNPEDWWKATIESINRALKDANISGDQIKSIGLSGQMHGSVFLDKAGQVLRPAILWNDIRTTAECREIENNVGGLKELLKHTRNRSLEGFTAPKILWFKKHEPDLYHKTSIILLPKDYIRYRLTGELAIDISDAAGTLLFDVAVQKWSTEVVKKIGLDLSMLPQVVNSTEICGYLKKEIAESSGLSVKTPVVAGGADNACGAVGAGVVKESQALSSIGTSGVLLTPSKTPFLDKKGKVHVFNHSVPEMWYLMGVMLSAGLSLRWFKENFAISEIEEAKENDKDVYDILSAEAEKAGPGCEGLIFLPYLNGERTPHADANARANFFGMGLNHKREHFIRSIMEGVAFGLRDSLEIFREKGIELKEIIAIGGGAKSSLWQQIQADIFQTPIILIDKDEGPAFGAALLAGTGIGIYSSVEKAAEQMVNRIKIIEPNNENVNIYDEYYDLYKSLYPALQEEYKMLAEIKNKSFES